MTLPDRDAGVTHAPTLDAQSRAVLLAFLATWLGYWALLWVLPLRAAGHAAPAALLVQLTFVWTVVGAYLCGDYCANDQPVHRRLEIDPRIVPIALAASALGTLCLAYDKVVVQGIDYSAGLAYAREQWRILGEARGGRISSPASALGYLLSPSYAVAIILLPLVRLRRMTLVCSAAAAIVLALANTLMTGGRSTLVLALLLYLVARMLARAHRPPRPALPLRSWLLTLALLGLSGIYFMGVFYLRAEAAGISVPVYVRRALEDLNVVPMGVLTNMSDAGIMPAMLNLLVMSSAYITHSFSTTVSIFEFGPQNNDALVIFVHLAGLARKLGLIHGYDQNWFAAGLFPSLPGALYLQGSWLGLVTGGAVLGGLLALALAVHRRAPSILTFCCVVAITCVLIASPALFVADVLIFPFILPQFVLYHALARWLARGRGGA